MMNRFEGSVVLVTGAAAGTGEAIARRFASEGATVAVCDLNEQGLAALADSLATEGHPAMTRRVDVTDGPSLEAFVADAVQQLGRLDVLVNNVGGGPFGNVEVIEAAEWRQTMAISLDSVYHACHAAVPHLKATRGSIVNIASIAGIRGEYDVPAYCAAKAGVLNLTRAMAWNLGPHGVRVNAVAPGATATPNMEWMWGKPELRAAMEAVIPLRRWAEPSDIAGVVAFLASPDAASITGVDIVVDGGMSLGTGSPRLTSLFASEG